MHGPLNFKFAKDSVTQPKFHRHCNATSFCLAMLGQGCNDTETLRA
jgi:hypothetical protein